MGCITFREQYLAGRATLGIDYPVPVNDWRYYLLPFVYRAVVVSRGRGGFLINQLAKLSLMYNAVTAPRGRAGNQIYQEAKLQFTYRTPVMIKSFTLTALAEIGSLR